jgi:rhodanese-related sulfurtransferase
LTGVPQNLTCGMDHSPGFLKLANDAKSRIKEISIEDAQARLKTNPKAVLIDVREDNEWNADHAVEAKHLGKGILERDLEKTFPDAEAEIIMYCGGGFRSAMTCDAAQKMGYKNVFSLAGGHKAMIKANWPMKSEG